MFQQLTLTIIFGMPLIFWMGLITFILLSSTATLGYLIYSNKVNIPIKYHKMLAIITIIIALAHGFLGMSLYLP